MKLFMSAVHAETTSSTTENFVEILISIKVSKIDVIVDERDQTDAPKQYIVNSRSFRSLIDSLVNDREFVTLGCKDVLLVVPFEGGQLNIITKNPLPSQRGLRINDASDILQEYGDAYLGYGLDSIFGPEFNAPDR